MYKNSVFHYIAKYMVDAMIILGAVCIAAIPYTAKILDYMGITLTGENINIKFMVILFLSGLCAEYILYNLRRMYKTLLGNNPFVQENVKCLRKCAVACMIIALLYLTKMAFMPTPATAVIILIFIVGALFCLTLKDIFKQAAAIKEENELTI